MALLRSGNTSEHPLGARGCLFFPPSFQLPPSSARVTSPHVCPWGKQSQRGSRLPSLSTVPSGSRRLLPGVRVLLGEATGQLWPPLHRHAGSHRGELPAPWGRVARGRPTLETRSWVGQGT